MKAKIILFAVLTAALIAVLPVLNLLYLDMNPKKSWYWQLYKGDLIITELSDYLRHYGISVLPEQVVIGKDGWMFLGDKYANTLSNQRRKVIATDIRKMEVIHASVKNWEQWLSKNGVERFHVMLGPNKSTIYAEYLPMWVAPVFPGKTDLFLDKENAAYIDVRDVLLTAKMEYNQYLYKKYDSHWNKLGGWLAYNAYMKLLTELRYCDEKTLVPIKEKEAEVNDLAQLLKLTDLENGDNPSFTCKGYEDASVDVYNYYTGGKIKQMPINEELRKPRNQPFLVKSESALNNKRILWLRDSFGNALTPFIAMTFKESLQINYFALTPEKLKELIVNYRPDYVLVTNVERQSQGVVFTSKLLLLDGGK